METTRRTLPTGWNFDGAAGYEFNANRVIALAKEYGWVDDYEYANEDEKQELLSDTEQDATSYLEKLAPDNHFVGWRDGGSFGVWPITWKTNQFRYIINLNERGSFSASMYRIDTATGEDEADAFFEIDTDEAEWLQEEGVNVMDGESVMEHYIGLGRIDMLGTGSDEYTILEQHDLAEEEDYD